MFTLTIITNYRILARKPFRTPRRRWEGNIKMDLTGLGFADMDWIQLA
jgi:hypothetical protein